MAFGRGPNIVTDGLVLALDAGSHKSYPGSGTTWYDLSGNGNNGTLNNGPTFTTNGVGSFFFDQTNDTVTTGKNGSELGIDDTAISGELIIKMDSAFPSNIFQGHMGFSGADGPNIKNGSSYYFLDTFNQSNTRILCPFHTATFFNSYVYTWLNLTFTFADETVKTYTNGEFYASYTLTGGMKTFQNADFNIAYGFGYYRTYGSISCVKLYNKELSASEVLQNYNATKSRFNL